MTIHLDTEIVATRHDPVSRANFYTVERNGRRWTVEIHMDEFNRCALKEQKRNLLGNRLAEAMLGKADEE